MRRLLRRRWVEIIGLMAGAPSALLVAVLLDHPALAAGPPAWTWPLAEPAAVVRPFDPPEHRYAAGHRGADVVGSPGAPVVAAGAGRVSYAGLLAGRGVVVVVHGQLRTTYEPVTAEVVVGQQVAAGEPLGRLEAGHEGCPAAACLHWGLRRGDDYLDPVQLVDPGPARLLPLQDGPDAAAVAVPAGAPSQVGAPQDAAPVIRPADTAPEQGRLALPAAPAPTVAEPHWSLRAAEAPAAAAAVVALAVGLALVARPRRPLDGPPDGPAGQGAGGGSAGTTGTATAGPEDDGVVVALPVDLASERARRRTAA